MTADRYPPRPPGGSPRPPAVSPGEHGLREPGFRGAAAARADIETMRVPSQRPREMGERLGPYRLVQVVGEGGMGVVHLGLDDRGRAVAIKVLRDHVAHDRDSRLRLAREVSSLARVKHPRVAPVLDADTTGPRPYVVTRYVPGVGLDDLVREDGPFDPQRLLRLGRGLAEAIEAIHAAGVVHRDLKPGNVLVVDDDPIVIDFGIAHVADDSRLTSTGLVMGTPGYLSPEVVGGQAVSRATDWWGWAATVAFAATGRPPFGRGPLHVVLDRVRDGQPDLDGLDPTLAALLSRALSARVGERPTPRELVGGLEVYATSAGAASAGVEGGGAEWGGAATIAQPRQATARMPVAPVQRAQPVPPVVQPAIPAQPVVEPAAAPAPRVMSSRPPSGATHSDTAPQPVDARPGQAQRRPDTPIAAEPHGTGPDADLHTGATSAMGDPRLGRPGRTAALTALAATVAALTATWPDGGFALATLWAIVARTADRVVTSTVLRRHAFGEARRSDGVVAALASPLHALVATLATILAGVLVAVVGMSVAYLVSVAGALGGHQLSPFGAPALFLGSLAATWVAWWGPGGTGLRRGSRTLVRAMTPTSTAHDVLQYGLVVVTLALLGWAAMAHGVPLWSPLGPPSGSGRIGWQW